MDRVVVRTKMVEDNLNKNSQINTEKEELIRGTTSKRLTISMLLIPIVLYILVCTLNEVSIFNIEGITGGYFRVITGVLAYTSSEILIVIGILYSFFRIWLVRINPKTYTDDLELDFLQEYLSLSSWERIKVDLFIFFSFLILVLVNTVVLLTRIPLV